MAYTVIIKWMMKEAMRRVTVSQDVLGAHVQLTMIRLLSCCCEGGRKKQGAARI